MCVPHCVLVLFILHFLEVVEEILLVVHAYLPKFLALHLLVGDGFVFSIDPLISWLIKSAQVLFRRGEVKAPQDLDLLDWFG